MKRMRLQHSAIHVSVVAFLAAATGHLSHHGDGVQVTTAFTPLMVPLTSRTTRDHHQHQQPLRNWTPIQMSMNDPLKEEELATNKRRKKNPTPVVVSAIQRAMDKTNDDDAITSSPSNESNKWSLSKTKVGMQLAAAIMAFSLAFLPVNNADAAMSGGRMGGSFSSSRPSMSRPAPSRSYSGGGGGYSRRSSYSSSRTTIITPGVGGYGGYGYGYGYNPFFSPFTPRIYGSPGVITYSRGPSFFDLLLVGGFTFAVVLPFLNSLTSSSSTTSSWDTTDMTTSSSSALGPGTSICQVSVALEVPDRDDRNSILSVLDRLAQTARTDSRVGIQNLSSQVALELLRRRSSIVSASSSYKHFNDRSKALREFQSRSVKERSKFESETVSQFGGVNYGVGSNKALDGSGVGGKATMAVVTLLLAIDGDSTKIPRINSVEDLERALSKISSDAKVGDCLQSAEILWTPTERWESLSARDVVADYPELRSI